MVPRWEPNLGECIYANIYLGAYIYLWVHRMDDAACRMKRRRGNPLKAESKRSALNTVWTSCSCDRAAKVTYASCVCVCVSEWCLCVVCKSLIYVCGVDFVYVELKTRISLRIYVLQWIYFSCFPLNIMLIILRTSNNSTKKKQY